MTMTEKRKILIVDDHAVLRDGLTEVINHSKELQVCGEAASAEEALEQIPDCDPDLVLIDLSLPGMNGLDLVKTIKTKHPGVKSLVLSMHDESLYAARSIRAGAKGYIMKRQVAREVEAAIRTVLAGDLYLSAKVSKEILQEALSPDAPRGKSAVEQLSDREREVYRWIGKGLGATEIARKLGINVKTIETYQFRIKEKLGLKDSAQLSHHAAQWVQQNEL